MAEALSTRWRNNLMPRVGIARSSLLFDTCTHHASHPALILGLALLCDTWLSCQLTNRNSTRHSELAAAWRRENGRQPETDNNPSRQRRNQKRVEVGGRTGQRKKYQKQRSEQNRMSRASIIAPPPLPRRLLSMHARTQNRRSLQFPHIAQPAHCDDMSDTGAREAPHATIDEAGAGGGAGGGAGAGAGADTRVTEAASSATTAAKLPPAALTLVPRCAKLHYIPVASILGSYAGGEDMRIANPLLLVEADAALARILAANPDLPSRVVAGIGAALKAASTVPEAERIAHLPPQSACPASSADVEWTLRVQVTTRVHGRDSWNIMPQVRGITPFVTLRQWLTCGAWAVGCTTRAGCSMTQCRNQAVWAQRSGP